MAFTSDYTRTSKIPPRIAPDVSRSDGIATLEIREWLNDKFLTSELVRKRCKKLPVPRKASNPSSLWPSDRWATLRQC